MNFETFPLDTQVGQDFSNHMPIQTTAKNYYFSIALLNLEAITTSVMMSSFTCVKFVYQRLERRQ